MTTHGSYSSRKLQILTKIWYDCIDVTVGRSCGKNKNSWPCTIHLGFLTTLTYTEKMNFVLSGRRRECKTMKGRWKGTYCNSSHQSSHCSLFPCHIPSCWADIFHHIYDRERNLDHLEKAMTTPADMKHDSVLNSELIPRHPASSELSEQSLDPSHTQFCGRQNPSEHQNSWHSAGRYSQK